MVPPSGLFGRLFLCRGPGVALESEVGSGHGPPLLGLFLVRYVAIVRGSREFRFPSYSLDAAAQ
eukprot:12535068-Prorocentrum_lima.AAC.1